MVYRKVPEPEPEFVISAPAPGGNLISAPAPGCDLISAPRLWLHNTALHLIFPHHFRLSKDEVKMNFGASLIRSANLSL